MEFTARGDAVWLSSRDDNRLTVIDTATLNTIAELDAEQPSGIFSPGARKGWGCDARQAMPEPCRMNAPISHPCRWPCWTAISATFRCAHARMPRWPGTMAGTRGELLAALRARRLTHRVLSRIGAVFAPNTVAASTLALAVPPDQLAAVAAQVSARREVSQIPAQPRL